MEQYYDITTYYHTGDRFHYGDSDYEVIRDILVGDKLCVYDKNTSPNGNIVLIR